MGGPSSSTLFCLVQFLQMRFKDIFVNHYGELRVGWRLLSFVILLTVILFVLGAPLRILGVRSDFAGRIVTLAATLGGSYVMTRFVNRKPFGAIGLLLHSHVFREFGIGCLLGFLMMSGIFVVELSSGFIHLEWGGLSLLQCVRVVLWALVGFSVAAFVEEALFRGYFFQSLIQWITFLPATLVLALVFAWSHYANPHATTFSLVNVGLAGVWLSIAYFKTRSLWLPFGLHLSWNFTQTTVYAFPTSGISFPEDRLMNLTQSGPEWMTGGAFGPEGGVLATIALVVCTWYILKSTALKAPEGIVTLDSVEDLLPPQPLSQERA